MRPAAPLLEVAEALLLVLVVPEDPSELVGFGVLDLHLNEPLTVLLMSLKTLQSKVPVLYMLNPPLTCLRAGSETLSN